MKMHIVGIIVLALAGCTSASPVKPVATIPVSQTLTEVRYMPIRPDLTMPVAPPPEAGTFGGLWSEVEAYRKGWAVIMARLACIAAIQDVPVGQAPPC